MRMRLPILIALLPLAASCSEANDAAYDATFTQSCTASAMAGGVTEADATSLCGCALAKVNERFTAAEKLTLSDEQAAPIVTECVAEMVQP